jgi:hypothetical protein
MTSTQSVDAVSPLCPRMLENVSVIARRSSTMNMPTSKVVASAEADLVE